MLDWNDILLHGIIAFGGFTVLSLVFERWIPGTYFVAFNTVYWPAREIIQHESLTGIFTSTQSFLEWTVPVAVGLTTALLFLKVNNERQP